MWCYSPDLYGELNVSASTSDTHNLFWDRERQEEILVKGILIKQGLKLALEV